MRHLVLLALTGCASAYTAEAPTQVASVDMADGGLYEIPRLLRVEGVDTDRMGESSAYNAELLESAALHLQMLPEAERRPVIAAMGSLIANCPYTRARVMVLMTLERQLLAVDPSTLTPEGQDVFTTMLRELSALNTFIVATEADALPTPLPSDYLAFGVRTVDGPTLSASDDPIALSYEAIAQVDAAVEAMPVSVQDDIQAAWSIVGPRLGDRIAIHFAERHTRDALARLAKKEPGVPDELVRLFALMDEMSQHGC